MYDAHPPGLSIIIPARNEAANIVATLTPLQAMRAQGVEVIVVDGGSTDETCARANGLCDQIVNCAAGRAIQMNAGAAIAKGETLLFLHADSHIPINADTLIREALKDHTRHWGRFDVIISGQHPMLKVIAWCMNHRSRISGIATGDQGIFVRRDTFNNIGRFPHQALMEDVQISVRLKKIAVPVCLRERIITSGRRWEKHGVWRTILTMWHIRLRYFFGATPDELHRAYYGK